MVQVVLSKQFESSEMVSSEVSDSRKNFDVDLLNHHQLDLFLDFKDKETKLSCLSGELSSIVKELVRLGSEITEPEKCPEGKMSEYCKLPDKLSELKGGASRQLRSAELGRLAAENGKLRAENELLRETYHLVKDELNSELEAVSRIRSDLQTERDSLKHELQRSQIKNDALRRKIHQLNDRMREARDSLTGAISRIRSNIVAPADTAMETSSITLSELLSDYAGLTSSNSSFQ